MPANNIHPKTSAAALGGALGLLIVTVLDSLHGINLSGAASAAIPTFLSTLGAFVAPSQTDTQSAGEAVSEGVSEDDFAGLQPQEEPAQQRPIPAAQPQQPAAPVTPAAAPGGPGGPSANPHPPTPGVWP